MVALVVSVAPFPVDIAVTDENEPNVEEDCDDETVEIDEFDDELDDEVATEPGSPATPRSPARDLRPRPTTSSPREDEAGLIAFKTPCRQKMAANCPDENPAIET